MDVYSSYIRGVSLSGALVGSSVHRIKLGFHPTQRTYNAMNATDGTDATTDEASDRPFDTPSFIINTTLLGFCFFNIALFIHLLCS